MLRNSDAMLAETPNVGLTNAFMSGSKGSDFFKYVIGQVCFDLTLTALGHICAPLKIYLVTLAFSIGSP